MLEWTPPHAKWFLGGKLNVAHNCLDRHLAENAERTALLWEGEPGDKRTYTYGELHEEVCRLANALKGLGVEKGDRVTIYLPMIPEAVVSMLACARIGAIHSVVFGGFSPESLADRNNDAESKVLITADGGWRRGGVVPLKANADEALESSPSIEHVVVVRRGGELSDQVDASMKEGRDHWYHELVDGASSDCPAEPMDSEDILYILYTSGTTGKPKGVVHTTGGYLTQAYATTQAVFDLHDEDVYWCTADVGWVTGHSYIVYGPLANCAQVMMYEGAPGLAGPGASMGALRALRRDDLLHGAHRDPVVHALGRRVAGQVGPVQAAPARDGGRADQPRGLDVVPRGDRRRSDAPSWTRGGRRRPGRS